MATQPAASPVAQSGPGARSSEPRHLPAGHGASWWSEGWRVFAASPWAWLGIVIILLILMFVLALIPVVGSIAQALLLPVFGGGVMLGCHALARGEPLRISHLFDGFAAGRFAPLAIVGLVVLAAAIVLGLIVATVAVASIGIAGLTALAALTDPTQIDLGTLMSFGLSLLLVLLLGLVGACLIAMAYWFAPALVVLDGEEPLAAMRRSFAACWRNLGAFLVYGII